MNVTTIAHIFAAMQPFLGRLTRDFATLVACIGLWLLDAHFRAQGASGWDVMAVGALAGAGAVAAAFIAHEWGHWLGAVLSGAEVTPRHALAALLFDFDETRNTRRQFLWMSLGGYLASVAAAGLIVTLASWEAFSGRTALVLTAIGLAVTFTVEMPQTLAALRRDETPGETP